MVKFIPKTFGHKKKNESPPKKYDNSIKEAIYQFNYRRVWPTKKIRMNAEERMNNKNLHSIVLVNYYTFFLLSYSLLGLYFSLSKQLSIVSVIVSTGLFGVSLYVSLYGYREKALAYKYSHIELDKIESKLEKLLLDDEISNKELVLSFHNIKDSYSEVISRTENHSAADYLKHTVSIDTATLSMKKKYIFFHIIPYHFFLVTLYLVPIVGFLIIAESIWRNE